MDEPEKGDPVKPCMDFYKKNQSDIRLEMLKLRILARGDSKNKEIIGYTWSPKKSMRDINYFLVDSSNHK